MFASETLILTNGCNFSCKYCFEHKKKCRMSLDTAKRALSHVIDNGHICFFGGEPLLEYETLIKPLSEEARKRNISMSMTTNGSLMTPEVFDWLKENNIQLMISFDGDKYTQDKHRILLNGSSFDATIDNLKYAILKDSTIPVRMTLQPETIHLLYDNVKFFYNLGVKRLCIEPNLLTDWQRFENILQEQMYKITEFKDIICPPAKGKNDLMICDKGVCGIGLLDTKVIVDSNGDFYFCHRMISPEWKVGDLDHGIDLNIVEEFKQKYNAPFCNKKCNNCIIKDKCNKGCVAMNYEATGKMNEQGDFWCLFNKIKMGVTAQ